jgi:hypothetical protein
MNVETDQADGRLGEDLRVRIAKAQKHRRGTLDVGKEEGERLRGQCLGLPWGRC